MREVPQLLGDSPKLTPFKYTEIPGGRTLTGSDIAAKIDSMEPWLYLRFTDGAFFSMCGTRRGVNEDGSHFYPDTCGVELRTVFHEAYHAIEQGQPIVIELARCWNQWPAICEAVGKMSARQRAATVMGPVLTRAVVDGSVCDILNSLRSSTARKAWVCQAADRPVVEAVGMTMLEAPRPEAWTHMTALEHSVKTWAGDLPALLVTVIGLPSRCLQWRLWQGQGVSIDVGSMADALMGRKTRSYLKADGRYRAVSQAFHEWQERYHE